MAKPLCIVVGIGPGNGAALARAFSAAGHALALLSRSAELGTALCAELPDARFYACDAGSPSSIEEALAQVAREQGDAEVLVWNAGSGVFGDVEHVSVESFDAAWRVNALGPFAAVQRLVPGMKRLGRGAVVFIGATASVKGGARTAAFSSAKFAQRGLAQSMARHLWPAGIHVAIIVVDGVVDLPNTRRGMPDKPDEFFIKPEGIAATAVALAKQDRSAWSFEVEARPFGERW